MSVYTTITPDALSPWLARYNVGELVGLKGIAAGITNTNYFVTTQRTPAGESCNMNCVGLDKMVYNPYAGMNVETSVKALFTASFLPGFMLAGFYVVYILVITRLRPDFAPLAEPLPGDPEGGQKFLLFLTFLLTVATGFTVLLLLRAVFMFATGQSRLAEGMPGVALGMPHHIPWFLAVIALCAGLILGVLGRGRLRQSWDMGKGLVAPLTDRAAISARLDSVSFFHTHSDLRAKLQGVTTA